jgi:probable blue pigment (indigoidine) exporter
MEGLMSRYLTIGMTALAPMIWGSTYLITTEFLPDGYPLTVALLRALPAGLLLLVMVRHLPGPDWWLKLLVLGALNFTIFWSLLFVAAYRLPGGVAATLGACQPLIVVALSSLVLRHPMKLTSLAAAIGGLAGVTALVLAPVVTLDPIGITAGLGGAVSMALGTVLTRKWQPPVSLLTFTAWQLTAGGLLLLPLALWLEPPLPPMTARHLIGFTYLGLIGAAATYYLWFRGIARLGPSIAALLGFFSPLTAVLLGWLVLGQQLSLVQMLAILAILISIFVGQFGSAPTGKKRLRT